MSKCNTILLKLGLGVWSINAGEQFCNDATFDARPKLHMMYLNMHQYLKNCAVPLAA